MFANGVSAIYGGFREIYSAFYMNFIEINCQLAYQKGCLNESFSSRFYSALFSHFEWTKSRDNLRFRVLLLCLVFNLISRRSEEASNNLCLNKQLQVRKQTKPKLDAALNIRAQIYIEKRSALEFAPIFVSFVD